MENRDTIKRLLSAFPSLSVSEAKAFLERHNWDFMRAFRAAEEEEEEKLRGKGKNTFYSGAGQLITTPEEQEKAKHLNSAESIEELRKSLFQKAESEASQGAGNKEGNRAFFGQGRRLGHTANPSPPMASTLLGHRNVSLELYQDGFHLENGDFIRLDSQEGRDGMKEMLQGYVPSFLQKLYPQTELSLTLHDKSSVPYSSSIGHALATNAESAAPVAFGGTGHRLTDNSAPSASLENLTSNEQWNSNRPFAVDENEEKSFIVLVSTKGKRNEYKVNPHRHTLSDVHTLAREVEPELSAFQLVVSGIPPRKLTPDLASQTISAAKLTRAVINIRKV